jgi:predicted metalloprotease with PDZ domain
MPKIVPGTYSVSDFGKFVSEFQALDKQGRPLPVERIDTNRWRISQAQNLDRLTYWVDDTFDAERRQDVVFEPGGTNIEEGKNFLINPFGFVGYFDGLKQVPYELTITKPAGFYGSTALQATSSTATTDTYNVPNYVELADSPLMYNKPDTTILRTWAKPKCWCRSTPLPAASRPSPSPKTSATYWRRSAATWAARCPLTSMLS